MSDEKRDGNKGRCLCEASETLIFPCSGASNVGQIANEVALRLREAGKGNMYCTAGIGGHVKGLVDGAKSARLLVGIDGCNVGCARRCLEGEGLQPGLYMIVSDEVKVKKGYVRPKDEDVAKAVKVLCSQLEGFVK